MDIHLTYDEAALFNSYNAPTKRKLIDLILRGSMEADQDIKPIALSLRYKIAKLSAEEYKKLYKSIPIECGV